MVQLTEIHDGRYAEAVRQNRAAVVVFGADFCVPCKLYKPVLDKVAATYPSELSFWYVDCMKVLNSGAPQEIKRSIAGITRGRLPTTVFYNDGLAVHSDVGPLGAETISEIIEKYLGIRPST